MELHELTTGMRYHLSLESLQDEEKMMYREISESDYSISNDNVFHPMSMWDISENIVGFTVPLNLT